MPVKGKGFVEKFFVQDLAAGGGKAGDAANLTVRIIKDSGAVTPTNGVSEIDATYAPGWYQLAITDAENSDTVEALSVISSTDDVECAGTRWSNEVEFRGATFDASTDSLEAIRNRVDVVHDEMATATGQADITTDIGAVDTVVDAILVAANELQTDWADGGRLDVLLDTASGSAGTSGSALTVTLSDNNAVLVDGSQVTLQTTGGVSLGVYETTGPASGNDPGVVVLTYPDGTYQLKVTDRSGYETHTAEAVVISGPTSKAITVTASTGTPDGVGWLG